MARPRRRFVLYAAFAFVALTLFLVPTLWGRPWSIEHFYTRVFVEFALDRPMLLSQLRLLEPYGLDFHSNDLDDFSVEFALGSAREAAEALEILRSYSYTSQSPSQQLSTDVLDWFLDTRRRGEPFLFHDYPVNQLDGIQSTLPDFMLNVHQIRDGEDADDYVARLSKFGTAFDQVIAGLRHREQLGIVPPRFVVERVQTEIREFLAPPPGRNVLYTTFADRLASVRTIQEDVRKRYEQGALRELEQTIYPAYGRLAGELEHLSEVAGEEDGVWRLPDGGAYYDWALRFHTTTTFSAEDLHRLGLVEVARIQAQIRELLESQGLPADDFADTLRTLNADARFLYPDSDAGRAQILADYQAIIDDALLRLPDVFGLLPRAAVKVERVPEFKQVGAPLAYYNPPPFDRSKSGIFYINLRNVGENPRFRMRTLAYHETIPGHHLQIAVAQELSGVPFFRRVLPFTAFVEGWALYAERLAAEQGYYPTPFDRLGQLVDELFRAVRLVVDTGIHAQRWNRAHAIDYMLANTGKPRSEVVAEIERYIVNPGQACAYKAGQLVMLEIRKRAREQLGERFDLREFHDVVLGGGALPLTLLERRVDRWIRSAL